MNAHATGTPDSVGNGGPDPMRWRICAVIVTYNPDQAFRERALGIAAQVDGVVIVDNGSAPATLHQLAGLASEAHLILNPANLGVATAQNQGIEYARAHDYTHALLFDHDTQPFPHMVATVRRIASTLPELDRVAALGINFLDATTRQPWYAFDSRHEDAVEITSLVSSGSLIPLAVVAQIGGMREDFFIDHLEDEYCLRARSRGYKVVIIQEPLAVHALGTPKIRRLPWRTIGTSNHSAPRRYYMTRNHIILIKKYALREPGWIVRTLYTRMKSFVLLLLFDDDRLPKIRLMCRGLLDGLAGRTGELGRAEVRGARPDQSVRR